LGREVFRTELNAQGLQNIPGLALRMEQVAGATPVILAM
jgi:hypothetical protein